MITFPELWDLPRKSDHGVAALVQWWSHGHPRCMWHYQAGAQLEKESQGLCLWRVCFLGSLLLALLLIAKE